MEKHFFTEKNKLYLAELKAKKMGKLKIKLLSLLIFSLMLILSPIGMLIFTLFLFLAPAFVHFLILDFDLNIWLILLGAHFVFYTFYFKVKYERELLPDFYVMKKSNQILKNRLKHHNYN